MSYQVSPQQAVESAGKLMKDGACESVKLEGGQEVAEHVHRIVRAGIPVVGHVGLTPQSVHALGGFKVQGRGAEGAEKVLADAIALEQAGAFAIVLEAIPPDLAEQVTALVSIPTIGIGAGAGCDGQVLVCTDLLGLARGHQPKFAKRFANLGDAAVDAFSAYVAEVRAGTFPGAGADVQAERGGLGPGWRAGASPPRPRGLVERRTSSTPRSRSTSGTEPVTDRTGRFPAICRDLEGRSNIRAAPRRRSGVAGRSFLGRVRPHRPRRGPRRVRCLARRACRRDRRVVERRERRRRLAVGTTALLWTRFASNAAWLGLLAGAVTLLLLRLALAHRYTVWISAAIGTLTHRRAWVARSLGSSAMSSRRPPRRRSPRCSARSSRRWRRRGATRSSPSAARTPNATPSSTP